MRKLIEVYGVLIISIITGAVIVGLATVKVISMQDMVDTAKEQIVVFDEKEVNKENTPVFTDTPLKEYKIQTDENTAYDWNYFINNITVKSGDEDITDNVIIRVYKMFDDDMVREYNLSASNKYLGVMTKDNPASLYDMDMINIDINGENYTGNDEDIIGIMSYKSFIDNDYNGEFTSKYRITFQVTNAKGYKAEYNSLVVLENIKAMNSSSFNICIPDYVASFSEFSLLKEQVATLMNNTACTINNSEVVDDAVLEFSFKVIDLASLVETQYSLDEFNALTSLPDNSSVEIIVNATATVDEQSIEQNKMVMLTLTN